MKRKKITNSFVGVSLILCGVLAIDVVSSVESRDMIVYGDTDTQKSEATLKTVPYRNNFANDDTGYNESSGENSSITVGVYQIKNDSSGYQVISFDKNDNQTYIQKVSSNGEVLFPRTALTTTKQEYGFNNVSFFLSGASVNPQEFQAASTPIGGKQLKRIYKISARTGSSDWVDNIEETPSASLKTITINYLDNETKKQIQSSTTYQVYNGQDVSLENIPEKISNRSVIKDYETKYSVIDSNVTINLHYEAVVFDPSAHKPTIDEPVSGSSPVTGTGVPGDTITLKDKDGNVIGSGVVDETGHYSITPNRPLVAGESISAVPTDGAGHEGTSAETTVFDPSAHKPTIDEPVSGSSPVTGTGVPGDTITLKDKDNGSLLPSTGSKNSFILEILGLVFSVSLILISKQKKKKEIS